MRNWTRRWAVVIGITLLVVLVGAAKPGLADAAALGLVVVWVARELRDRRRAPRLTAAAPPAPPTHCAVCGTQLDADASFCGACGSAARARIPRGLGRRRRTMRP